MASVNPPIINFTGGILGERLHNRVDIPSYANGAEEMVNFRPNIQGIMSRRPAALHVDTAEESNKSGDLWPFYFAIGDTYLLDVYGDNGTTDGFCRFYANDGLLTIDQLDAGTALDEATSPNPFDASAGSASATDSGTYWSLASGGGEESIVRYVYDFVNNDTQHTLKFEVLHGPISVRVSETAGQDDLLLYEDLQAGVHLLTFTPTTTLTFYIDFFHDDNATRFLADTVEIITTTTDFHMPLPYLEDDLPELQLDQIKDVLYITHEDYITRRLIRRADKSWSLELFEPTDGPFNNTNTGLMTLTSSSRTGLTTLTASEDYFTANDVGVLYSITTTGQLETAQATSADVQTGGIEVTGPDAAARTFTIDISGTFVATVTLQRSSGNEENYVDFQTYTTPQTVEIYDDLENQVWFYRLAVKSGDYTSGTVDMEISIGVGSTTGIVRVMEVASGTSATAEVLRALGANTATSSWARGAWNADDGYPRAISLAYSRLFFGRGNTLWGSKPDDFTSFDAGNGDLTDDSIIAEIGSPSDDAIRWLGFANHLVIGTAIEEKIGLGNTDSDPIGPENFQVLPATEEGGAIIQPVKAAQSILYVHRSRTKVMQFTQDPNALSDYAYISIDLTARAVEILEGEQIVDMAVLREPERRIFVVTASGKLFELLFRREGELDIVAWSEVETSGRIEKVAVIQRSDRDVIYLRTRRKDQNDTWVRYIEQFYKERPVAPDQYVHLDNAISFELEKPTTQAEVSATTGTVTVKTDDDVFDSSDVDAVLWINGGRGTIATYVSATEVTMTVTTDLDHTKVAAAGTWGFNQPADVMANLDHLEGQTVKAYGDGINLGSYTVASGQITLSQQVSWAHVGIGFESRWKSLKLAYGSQKGTALTMPAAIKKLVFLFFRSHPIKFGPSFTRMWDVKLRRPSTPLGEPIPYFSGESDENDFDGGFDTDSRLCLKIEDAGPCSISGLVPRMDTRDR